MHTVYPDYHRAPVAKARQTIIAEARAARSRAIANARAEYDTARIRAREAYNTALSTWLPLVSES